MYACTMASSWRQRRTAAPAVSRYRSGPDRYRAGRIVPGPIAAPGRGAGRWPRRCGSSLEAAIAESGGSVADLGEWGIIAALAARMPSGPRTAVGIGDDAAVVGVPS